MFDEPPESMSGVGGSFSPRMEVEVTDEKNLQIMRYGLRSVTGEYFRWYLPGVCQ